MAATTTKEGEKEEWRQPPPGGKKKEKSAGSLTHANISPRSPPVCALRQAEKVAVGRLFQRGFHEVDLPLMEFPGLLGDNTALDHD